MNKWTYVWKYPITIAYSDSCFGIFNWLINMEFLYQYSHWNFSIWNNTGSAIFEILFENHIYDAKHSGRSSRCIFSHCCTIHARAHFASRLFVMRGRHLFRRSMDWVQHQEQCVAGVKRKITRRMVDTRMGDMFYLFRFQSIPEREFLVLCHEFGNMLVDFIGTYLEITNGLNTQPFSTKKRELKFDWKQEKMLDRYDYD